MMVFNLQDFSGVGHRDQVPVGHEAPHLAGQDVFEAIVRAGGVEGEFQHLWAGGCHYLVVSIPPKFTSWKK